MIKNAYGILIKISFILYLGLVLYFVTEIMLFRTLPFLEGLTILLLISIILSLNLVGRIYWYKVSIMIYITALVIFVLLSMLLIVFPTVGISLGIASTFSLWIIIVVSISSFLAFTLANVRIPNLRYITAVFLITVFLFGGIFLTQIFRTRVTYFYVYLGLLFMEVLNIGYILRDPFYFFNISGVASIFSLIPILYTISAYPLFLTLIIIPFVINEEYLIYNSLKRQIREEITMKVKKNLDYSKEPTTTVNIAISTMYDKQFVYDLFVFGHRLSTALFSFIGEIEWIYVEDNISDAVLKMPIHTWIEAIKQYTSREKSQILTINEFLNIVNLNKYQLQIAADYLKGLIILNFDKQIIYIFGTDYQPIFTKPLQVKDKIEEILDFCPENVLIEHLLSVGGKEIPERTLLWLLKSYKLGKISKRRIIEILSNHKQSYTIYTRDIVKAIKKKGINGFIEALKELGIEQEMIEKVI